MKQFRHLVPILAALVLIAVLAVNAPVSAADEAVYTSGDYSYTLSVENEETVATITQYTGHAESVTIPSSLDGYRVTSIKAFAFEKKNNLRSVTIPDTVIRLGSKAFDGCDSLSHVDLPANWQYLSPYSTNGTYGPSYGDPLYASPFTNCPSLKRLVLPDGNTYVVVYAFKDMKSLEEIVLPESLVTVSEGAFSGCSNLKSVVIPDTVTEIYARAFDGCTSLTSVKLPAALETIYAYAFNNCTSLPRIELPEGLITIYGRAFNNCSTLSEVVFPTTWYGFGPYGYSTDYNMSAGDPLYDTPFSNCDSLKRVELPEGTLYVAPYAFYGMEALEELILPDSLTIIKIEFATNCTSLKTLKLPRGLSRIAYNAFNGCSSLTTVELPDSLKEIYRYAFANCDSLTEVVIPEGVVEISGYAFYGCDNLSSVTLPSTWETVDYAYESGNNFSGYQKVYESPFVDCPRLTSITIPDGMITVPKYAFAEMTSLQEVTFSLTATTVDEYAFSGCTGLASLEFSASVQTLKHAAFSGCTGLKEVVFSPYLLSIGADAFSGCTALAALNLPEGLEQVSYRAFENCDSLTQVEIPDTVKEIGSSAFGKCDNLTRVRVSMNWTNNAYGDSPFAECPLLEEIILPEGMTVIPGNAFTNIKSLPVIQIPESVTEIGDKAFSGSGLTEIELPDHIHTMGTQVFQNCTELTRVKLPAGFDNVPEYTFDGCTKLTDVELPDGLLHINEAAFQNCKALASIDLPQTVQILYRYAFKGCESLKEMVFPADLYSLGHRAFADCTALETVVTSQALKGVGSHAFYNCKNLKSVTLNHGMTYIPESCFQNCTSLTEIVIPYSVTQISANAFKNAAKLAKVVTHGNLTSIDNTAFSYPYLTVFCGEAGSYTEEWAQKNRYTFLENTTPVSSLSLNQTEAEIPVSGTLQILWQAQPLDFGGKAIFSTSDETVAAVDENGLVTAVAPGEAVITLQIGACSTACHVSVYQNVDGLDIVTAANSGLIPGETLQLEVTCYPENAMVPELIWTSEDESVLTVDENGLVTAVGVGSTWIQVAAAGLDIYDTIEITVNASRPIRQISLNVDQVELNGGESYQLISSLQPENTSERELVWSSSDPLVATVDENGLVTAHYTGAVLITVTSAANESVSGTCWVYVEKADFIADDISDLETPHDYPSGGVMTWTYTAEGAQQIQVTFDKRTAFENRYDNLSIYFWADGQYQLLGTYTGTELAGATVEIPGDRFLLELAADISGSDWGFKVTELIPSYGHDHDYTAKVTEPTCTEDGYTTYTCECGDSYVADPVPATGHRYEDGTCTDCGEADPDYQKPVANPFSDVKESDYFLDPVLWAVEKGITAGTGNGNFSPNNPCTRGQVVTFLWRAAGQPEPNSTENPFTDVSPADYFYKPVLWAVENGITAGLSKTTFGPNETCTRGQVVTFLWRAAGKPGTANAQNDFTDVTAADYFYKPVLWAVENGITAGMGAGKFAPNNPCTRGQVVTFLYRAFSEQ